MHFLHPALPGFSHPFLTMDRISKLITICMLIATAGLAKECPSRLLPNLRPIGGSPLSWGMELHASDYSISGTNYWFFGLSVALAYETDTLSVFAQGEYKEKKYSACQYPEDISPFKAKRLSLDWKLDRFTISGGRQEVTAGLGLGLDDFFDGLRIAFADKNLRAEMGAVVLARSVAREAFSCQTCFFFEYTASWKNLKQSTWGDDKLIFANLTWKIAGHSLGLLYLKSIARDDLFDFQQLDVHGMIKLPLKFKLQLEVSGQRFDHSAELAYGHLVELGRRIPIEGLGTFEGKLKHLYGSASDNVLFTPLYGNASFGERMHYGVRQGSIWGGTLKFQPEFAKRLEFNLQYYQNDSGFFKDIFSREWDAGLTYAIDKNKRYQLYINYARTSGLTGTINQIAAEMRIVF